MLGSTREEVEEVECRVRLGVVYMGCEGAYLSAVVLEVVLADERTFRIGVLGLFEDVTTCPRSHDCFCSCLVGRHAPHVPHIVFGSVLGEVYSLFGFAVEVEYVVVVTFKVSCINRTGAFPPCADIPDLDFPIASYGAEYAHWSQCIRLEKVVMRIGYFVVTFHLYPEERARHLEAETSKWSTISHGYWLFVGSEGYRFAVVGIPNDATFIFILIFIVWCHLWLEVHSVAHLATLTSSYFFLCSTSYGAHFPAVARNVVGGIAK